MWYSADEKRFVCLWEGEEINDVRKLYLRDYIIENFENISPITHINIYKRDYTSYNGIKSDWNFRDFNWRDKDTLEIRFGDMSLDIEASLDVIETETWTIVSNFRINHVGVYDWNFEEKYYNSIETIKEWLK
jgi:hypothetical protein